MIIIWKGFEKLANINETVLDFKQSLQELKDVLAQESELTKSNKKALPNKPNISIKNLRFYYSDDQELPTLNDISIQILMDKK